MADLEERIRAWRRHAAEALGGQADVIEELECHLREEVRRLLLAGQPLEQAWLAAVGRLGSPRQVAAEFAKLERPGQRTWWPARLALLGQVFLTVGVVWLVFSRVQQGRMGLLLALHVIAVTVGYLAGFAVGTLAVWSVLARAAGGWDARRSGAFRSATLWLSCAGLPLVALGVVLGCFWARVNLGHYWLWDVREVAAVAVMAWQGVMLWWLWRRPAAELGALVLGVAGNVVVSLGWFGATLVLQATSAHSYGYNASLARWLLGFITAHLLIVAVAFAPIRQWVRRRA